MLVAHVHGKRCQVFHKDAGHHLCRTQGTGKKTYYYVCKKKYAFIIPIFALSGKAQLRYSKSSGK